MREKKTTIRGKVLLGFAAGVLTGIVAAGAAGWILLPGLMLTTHQSPYDVEETCLRLRRAIEANGWNCPAVRDMNQSMAQQGVEMDAPVRIVELCNAAYAKEVLQTNPEMSTMMPCAFGVYRKDGRVYVTGLNTGLMGKMFGGNVAAVMGDRVAADERKILECLK